MSRFANRKLLSHHITPSRFDSMLRQHAARDCHTPRSENSTWSSRSAMDDANWKEAPRLLRYLGGDSQPCSVCGLDAESKQELIGACSECLLNIEAALTNPGRDQAGMDQSRRDSSSGKKRTKVAKESQQPLSIIIMQNDKPNALVDQLTTLLNRACSQSNSCPATQQQGQQQRQQQRQQQWQQQRQQQWQQQWQQPGQQQRQQRSQPSQRYSVPSNSPKNMSSPDPMGFNCFPQLVFEQQSCKYTSYS